MANFAFAVKVVELFRLPLVRDSLKSVLFDSSRQPLAISTSILFT